MVKVSVILPVYNRQDLVKESIESVLNQTFEDFELIIVDDGSTDGTPEMLEKDYSKFYPKMSVIYLEKNTGISNARNVGCNAAKGEYIAFLSSDDTWEKDFLMEMIQPLTKFPDDLVFCRYNYIGDRTGFQHSILDDLVEGHYLNKRLAEEILNWAIRPDLFICYDCVLGKREYFIGEYGFPTELLTAEDLYHALLLAFRKKVNFYFVDRFLANYRWHAKQDTFVHGSRIAPAVQQIFEILKEDLK